MSSTDTCPTTNRNNKNTQSLESFFHHYPNAPSNPISRPKHFCFPSDPTDLKKSSDFAKLNSLLDNICKKTLDQYYPRTSESEFKNKFDKLNLKFYLETEKYLHDRIKQSHCQITFFVLLFQQINICIEEIARLNKIIEQQQSSSEAFHTQTQLVATLKQSNTNLEKRLSDLLQRENKLIIQNEQLTKQLAKHSTINHNNNTNNQQLFEIKENMDVNNHHMKTEVIVSDLEDFYNKRITIEQPQQKINVSYNQKHSTMNRTKDNNNTNNKQGGNNSFNSIQNIIKTVKNNNNYKKKLLNNTCLKQKYDKETG